LTKTNQLLQYKQNSQYNITTLKQMHGPILIGKKRLCSTTKVYLLVWVQKSHNNLRSPAFQVINFDFVDEANERIKTTNVLRNTYNDVVSQVSDPRHMLRAGQTDALSW